MKTFITTALCCLAVSTIAGAAQPEIPVRIANYKGDKTCAISYTFDDGMTEQYTLAAPQLERHGFRGTFWINAIGINEDAQAPADTTHISWSQLKEMADNGHEISNHSYSHKKLTRLTTEEIIVEVRKNDTIIREKLGFTPLTFCYPYNAHNEEVLRIASENRVDTRTKQFAIGSKSTPESLEQKINELLASGEWGVAMTHGINYGYDAFPDATVFWEHLEKVKAQEDKIWIGTFCEVGAYIKERDAILLKVTPNKKGLTITPRLPLNKKLFNEPLTAVIDKAGVKKVTVIQGEKSLEVHILPNKLLFDFDPSGSPIHIVFKE